MSKTLIWILIFFILLFFFIYGFSNSYISRNLSNLAYVFSLGIDKGENSKFKITAQFTKNSAISKGNSSDDSSNFVLTSCEADSIFSGINLINSYIGREVNLAHCSVVVFSKEIAEQGISEEIYSLINNEEIRPGANLVISNCSAYDYINNVKPNIETLASHYYETFSITSKFTGYIADITIGNFFNDLSGKSGDSTAILGGLNLTARDDDNKTSEKNNSSSSGGSESGSSSTESSSKDSENSNNSSEDSSNNSESGGESSENSPSSSNEQNSTQSNVITSQENLIAGSSSISGERGTENLGLAVFKNDKYCGDLTVSETISHLLINNKISTCVVSINNPLNDGSKMELQISPEKKAKINTKIENDKLKINVKLDLVADIISLDNEIDYENNVILEKVSETASSYFNEELNKYFNKISKEYSVDIDKFCLSSLKYFPTEKDFENFNWDEKYKNAEFSTDINVNVVSSLLVTKT